MGFVRWCRGLFIVVFRCGPKNLGPGGADAAPCPPSNRCGDFDESFWLPSLITLSLCVSFHTWVLANLFAAAVFDLPEIRHEIACRVYCGEAGDDAILILGDHAVERRHLVSGRRGDDWEASLHGGGGVVASRSYPFPVFQQTWGDLIPSGHVSETSEFRRCLWDEPIQGLVKADARIKAIAACAWEAFDCRYGAVMGSATLGALYPAFLSSPYHPLVALLLDGPVTESQWWGATVCTNCT